MAIITRFDPFRDLTRIQEERGRMLDEREAKPAESIGRTFALPTSVDPEKVHAQSKHGVLAVHLPRRSEAWPRSIQVKVQ
jgi:HSP20 family protein